MKIMIIRIKEFKILDNFRLYVVFDDGRKVIYDVKNDIDTLPGYKKLEKGDLFGRANLDESRTCISWTAETDLPADIIYEYGTVSDRQQL